jgi:ribonuclease HII
MYEFEHKLIQIGKIHICGVDEAGRGPLAGPVVAAAVILKPGVILKHVKDSKQLSKKQLLVALEEVKQHALAIKVVFGSVEDIDRINIYRATKEAMVAAIEGLDIQPDFILTDAMPIPEYKNLESIIKGDQKSISIAAASIIAKTTRDAYMKNMHTLFPLYGFDQHKGYPTKKHIEALMTLGPTPIHRKSFQPVKDAILKFKK